MRLTAVLHSCAKLKKKKKKILHAGAEANICYMCGGVRVVERFGSQRGVNVLSVHV